MPKIIELTVEISIQKVSCPGVWLCQDGRVCLTVFALGTSYQTCLLPPIFPLMFKDVFYFKKRFQPTCALNNICCFLKDETIYCELIQWTEDCVSEQSVILAQFLGAMNDVLFPPNVCSNDSVDLLMRRSKHFPGILSPKIEIATKIRIDEIWHQASRTSSSVKLPTTCRCNPRDDAARQKQVCHTARYHRLKCTTNRKSSGSRSRSNSGTRSKSRSRSGSAGSYCSLNRKYPTMTYEPTGYCPNPVPSPGRCSRSGSGRVRARNCREYCVYNVNTYPLRGTSPRRNIEYNDHSDDDDFTRCSSNGVMSDATEPPDSCPNEDKIQRTTLESRYIDQEKFSDKSTKNKPKKYYKTAITPCVCEICKRYHELFHKGQSDRAKDRATQCIYRHQ